VTEFRSFDNSTWKRVLDPLKPSDLTLGQITMPAPHFSVFCRPDALPAAQPTVSQH